MHANVVQGRNRLARQTSPYLQQHAENPVDWYPWEEEALERARREDKPILLSIGYSACHWCHVMAHESFEDPETARVMNELFVNIKVDREERPDLDAIYQTAHQFLTQRAGGWPLTVFLTPDQTPFVAGTYFPPQQRHGLPGFRDILQRVASFYQTHRAQVLEQNASLREALAHTQPEPAATAGELSDTPVHAARSQLAGAYDTEHGGFGGAPKFPHPSNLELLLRLGQCGDEEAGRMALHTIRAMAEGGLYDHLGGGFYRYSVDARWDIPHFEKMLYDNGPLLSLMVDGWQLTGDPELHRAAGETGAWAMREMQSPEGGYFSTLDADSEGEEGRFYLWQPAEVRKALGAADYPLFAAVYGMERPANFEGRWHLRIDRRPDAVAAERGVSNEEMEQRLATARQRLFRLRRDRAHPGRDEKVLTSWNALMIKGMASAGRRLVQPQLVESAERALDFIRTRLFRNGRLLAVYKDGEARLPAYLDDYAFLIDAVLELLQARWRDGDLTFAGQLAEALLAHFEDRERGGFFFTADDHEPLIQRPKPFDDASTPSGNGVAAAALDRLSALTGDMGLRQAAQRALQAGWPAASQFPSAHATLLMAIEDHLEPPQSIVLRGNRAALGPWLGQVNDGYRPRRLVLAIPPEARDLPGILAQHRGNGAAVAYVCGGHQCSPPLHELEQLQRALDVAPPCV